jgi:acyl-CoA thioester hydrolase
MGQHVLHIEVPTSAIDALGHVNNVEYVRWMQEAATAHSDAAGCTAATFADGAVWVVRSHHIEYLRPALAGDTVEVRTWVEDLRRVASLRRYEFVRPGDGAILARGETDWVYVDAATYPRFHPCHVRRLGDCYRSCTARCGGGDTVRITWRVDVGVGQGEEPAGRRSYPSR